MTGSEAKPDVSPLKVMKSLAVSATAACISEAVSLPLDTAKVRLQLQNKKLGASQLLYKGPIQTVSLIARTEGPAALFKGLEAGLHRQCLFTGIRLGLYSHIQKAIIGDAPPETAPVHVKVLSAVSTSAIGITIANPSDVVKVRTQASGRVRAAQSTPCNQAASSSMHSGPCLAKGAAPNPGNSARRLMCTAAASHTPSTLYTGSAVHVYGHIARTEGILGGLYAGYTPNLLRNSVISTSEIVSYDLSKSSLKQAGISDGPLLHGLSGVCAGLVATLLGSPMDILATRIMVQAEKGGKVPSMMAMCNDMVRKEGLLSLYQGFLPNFARIGSFNVVLWMSLEQLHLAFGDP